MDSNYADRLFKHSNLTTILVQFENFLDGLDLYVFENWIEGEIHSGPNINRYWVDITLLYPHLQMPNPQGAVRLIKHGAKVNYTKSEMEVEEPIFNFSDYRPDEPGKPKMKKEPVWLINIQIPRKFIEELDDEDLEFFDDEVDVDDISDARDENIDQDDAYRDESTEEVIDEE